MMQKSCVVLSGGQDSVTCLYLAKRDTEVVGAVHFDYGQRHGSAERECAQWHTDRLGIALKVLDVPAFAQIGDSALIGDSGNVALSHSRKKNLPASFVPGRNLVLLTLAGAYAQTVGATQLWTGVCETDFSGYPDCRRATIDALQTAMTLGTEYEMDIITPLMKLDKAQTFKTADELGVLKEVIEHTHTCYNGEHDTLHPWGYGCGWCPACNIRREGFEKFTI